MRTPTLLLCAALLAVPYAGRADIASGDLPSGTVWYFHADLEKMRTTPAGSELYGWLQDEAIVEINDELEIDLNREIDSITAFSEDGAGIIALVEGNLSQGLRDRVMALVGENEAMEAFEYKGKTYYHGGDEESATRVNRNTRIAHDGYFTFDLPGKLVVASEEAQMKALIDNDGRVAGAGSGPSMLVLSADQQFVQAGMRTGEFADHLDDGDGDGGWASNILRNTEAWALLVSDTDGMLSIAGKLISTDPAITLSLASIVNGVIALQAFSGDLDPEISTVLRNTRVTANGNELSLSTVVSPTVVVNALAN